MRTQSRRRGPGLEVAGAFVLFAALGCSAEASSDPIVGSGNVVDSMTQARFVRKVSVSLPFRAEIVNGQPEQLLLRGEDNLLDEIAVVETVSGEWKISAPQDLAFEQHMDMTIAVPYADMVVLALDGDDIVLKQRPGEFWRDEPETSEP